jgi:hypothetical protein
MKLIEWKDTNGLYHLSLIRDSDPDSNAPQGLPQDPPDITQLNWREIQKALHNELVVRRLITLEDVTKSQSGLTAAILAALRRQVAALYRSAKDGG